MSTHCGIAVKQDTGYMVVYCHHDGYPEYMLPMLRDNYNTEELAVKLVNFGDASSIREKLEPTTAAHSFNKPEDNVCIFYNRDLKESWFDVSPEYYLQHEKLSLVSGYYYLYLFEDGCWTFYNNGRKAA